MPVKVEKVHDKVRRCGLRHKGLYLMGGELSAPCGLLPLPLDFCPCCGQKVDKTQSLLPGYDGLNVARAWTKVAGKILRGDKACRFQEAIPSPKRERTTAKECRACVVKQFETAYMLWVGADNYTVAQFLDEAREQGISKRIPALPKDFVIGETVVLLAHAKAIHEFVPVPERGRQEVVYTPGVFAAFIPSHVEYVTDGSETEAELQRLVERDIVPVQVIVDEDRQPALPVRDLEAEAALAKAAAKDY